MSIEPDAVAENPPRSRREDTRGQLIKAAASVFAARGVTRTTVEDILRAAVVSRRTFYQHFTDKHDVLAAIYDRSIAHLDTAIREALDGDGTGAERIFNALAVYFDFQAQTPAMVRVLATEAWRPESALAERRRVFMQDVVRSLGATYHEAEGVELDPLVFRCIVQMADGLCVHVLTETPADRATVDHVKRVLWQFVSRTLQA